MNIGVPRWTWGAACLLVGVAVFCGGMQWFAVAAGVIALLVPVLCVVAVKTRMPKRRLRWRMLSGMGLSLLTVFSLVATQLSSATARPWIAALGALSVTWGAWCTGWGDQHPASLPGSEETGEVGR